MTGIDWIGQRFGRVVVIAEAPPVWRPMPSGRLKRRRRWLVRCDCTGAKIVRGEDLRAGKCRSCGCLERESRHRTTHGHARVNQRSRTYTSWCEMIRRCVDSKRPNFKYYGGRGVTVCDRWHYGENEKSGFECLLEDMGECPPGHTLHRCGDAMVYCKENCRWATVQEQASDKRSNRFITAFGRTDTIANFCREFRLSYNRLHRRLKAGWDVEPALLIGDFAVSGRSLSPLRRGLART